MNSFVITLSLNASHAQMNIWFASPTPQTISLLMDQLHCRTRNMSLRSIRYWETISLNQHTSVQPWNTQCQCFFSTSSFFFYHYVNLLLTNYATAPETELLYLSIEEHGDNLNPVFKDILYAAFYKRKGMYYFFYAS